MKLKSSLKTIKAQRLMLHNLEKVSLIHINIYSLRKFRSDIWKWRRIFRVLHTYRSWHCITLYFKLLIGRIYIIRRFQTVYDDSSWSQYYLILIRSKKNYFCNLHRTKILLQLKSWLNSDKCLKNSRFTLRIKDASFLICFKPGRH